MLIILIVSLGLAQCQNLYGPSQLESYFRLLRHRNLGGFGGLENAARQLQVAERQSFLSGLPPLPMTHDEVIHVLTTESPTTTSPPTARPTTPPLPVDPFANNNPEGPPIPEERIGGTYDDDGNFVASNLVTDRKRNVARGARNYQLSDTATTKQYPYVAQFHQPIHHPHQQRAIRQHTTQRPFTYPPLVFRAKPQPQNRDTYLNNLLLEIEEYDDFLDQVSQYKSRYPGAQVPNPYRQLPEGKLPALAQYKTKK